jgi:hypothetical protein
MILLLLAGVPLVLRSSLAETRDGLTELLERRARLSETLETQVLLLRRCKDILDRAEGVSYDRVPDPMECYATLNRIFLGAGLDKIRIQAVGNQPEGRIAVGVDFEGPYYSVLNGLALLRRGPSAIRVTGLSLQRLTPDRVSGNLSLEVLRR